MSKGRVFQMVGATTAKLREPEHCAKHQFFQFTESGHNLRGHRLKLFLSRNASRIRRTFFSQRVVTDWNRLPQHVIEAPSTNAFKNRLDKFWQQDMSI